MKPTLSRMTLRLAAFFGLLSVVLGAFGAHALKETLSESNSLETWKTAVDYQMWHALALLITAAYLKADARISCAINLCFGLGILLFSGSLYWLALGGPKWLGPITPLGGLLLIGGWCLLLAKSFQTHQSDHK